MMAHHIEIPSTHKACPKDLALLRGLLAWWERKDKLNATPRGQLRMEHLKRQITEAEKELQE